METFARIRHIENRCFEASTHSAAESFFIDGAATDQNGNGKGRGPRPMENVLLSLASCSSIDIVSILAKSKQTFSAFHVDVTATRRETIPKVFTRIDLAFHFTASQSSPPAAPSQAPAPPLNHVKIEHAIKLSLDKYCSVAAMLRSAGVELHHSLHIHHP